MSGIGTRDLLDLSHTLAGDYLAGFAYPWEALDGIRDLILSLGPALPEEEYDHPAPTVWIHRTAAVAPTAFLGEAVIIGRDTEVRHCAFLRGSALVGEGCVVGNSAIIEDSKLDWEVVELLGSSAGQGEQELQGE